MYNKSPFNTVLMDILSQAKVGKKGGFQISNVYGLFAGKIMAENWLILTKHNLKYEYWHSTYPQPTAKE